MHACAHLDRTQIVYWKKKFVNDAERKVWTEYKHILKQQIRYDGYAHNDKNFDWMQFNRIPSHPIPSTAIAF